MPGKYVLSTLGCKVNQYESQQVRELVESVGFQPASAGERADLAIVNTCAVTSSAQSRNCQTVRRVSDGGNTPVIVIGCGATADADRLRRIRGVLAVLGHDAPIEAELRRLLSSRMELPSAGPIGSTLPTPETAGESQKPGGDDVWMNSRPTFRGALPVERRTSQTPLRIISRPLRVVKTPDLLLGKIERFDGHRRAFLKVQDGCDAHCTYCIIPQLRPVLRSKPIDHAVAEARGLVAGGFKEIVLTGIFLGAYGRDTAIRKRFHRQVSPLARLVAALADVEGLERLRLSSLEPGDVDDELLEVLSTRPNCVPHLHLPLQSGSRKILRRMNRQYTREQFGQMIDRVRKTLDRPAITTDVIVGFPGESEEDFAETAGVCRDAAFCKIHAFPFSARPKTAAARWQKDFVAKTVVGGRMRILAGIEAENSISFRRSLLGSVERVIVEQRADAASPGLACGRADRYIDVWFDVGSAAVGDVIRVFIHRVTPTRTHGQPIAPAGSDQRLFVLSNSA